MEYFRKKTPVSVVIDCSRSKFEAEVSTRIRDLEPSIDREEKEIVEVKAGMSEERIESDSIQAESCSNQKKERGHLIGGVKFGSTSPDHRSNSPIAAMKL
jgi:hypothetical protein